MAKIKVLLLKPNVKTLEELEIPNELTSLQKLVDGFIEMIPFQNDIVMLVNEDGLVYDLPHNINYGRLNLVGNILFVKTKGEDMISLNTEDITIVTNELKNIGRIQILT